MMVGPRESRRGITLIELLMVVAIMGIIVGMVVPQFDPGVADQLQSAAMVISADLDYARSLAIANNSQYTVTFDIQNNRYFIHHSGTNDALYDLPSSPFLDDDSSIEAIGERQIADLDELLQMGPQVQLAVARLKTSRAAFTQIEFNPLGSTTATDSSMVYLSCGEGKAQRYLPLTVSSVTGLVTVGELISAVP
jgi:prepilin-type N-terminal cleavage/methylation domain-containing protein